MSAALVKALVALAAMAAVAELAAAKSHTIEWSLGGNYGDWSNGNAVSVGDTVVFTYSPTHTVHELSEADYKACIFGNAVSSDRSGSTAFTFDKAGTRYFACATGSHCAQGQKVAITVATSSSPGGQSPATPSGNGSSAASSMAGAGELAMKLALGLGVGGALLAAF
ncbi:hypothetical protein BS78_06G239500 [Paspalum vaginatum]|nr:hypothetical protein BS78_06G239500 [Paspalum vaginatum]